MGGSIVPDAEILANLRQSLTHQVYCLNNLEQELIKFRLACDVSADRWIALDSLMNQMTRLCKESWRMAHSSQDCCETDTTIG